MSGRRESGDFRPPELKLSFSLYTVWRSGFGQYKTISSPSAKVPIPIATPTNDPPVTDEFTITAETKNVGRVDGYIPPNNKMVVYYRIDGGRKEQGTTFTRTVSVARGGATTECMSVQISVYWQPDSSETENWAAEASLFSVDCLPPKYMPQ